MNSQLPARDYHLNQANKLSRGLVNRTD